MRIVRSLYELHGEICWLCKRPMDVDVPHPDLMSITIDHVVPLSLKGTWDLWNLRLAHKACNHARGNSIDADEITERISRLLSGDLIVSRKASRKRQSPVKTESVADELVSGRKRQQPPREEKESWSFWIDGRRVVGTTYFERCD